MNKAETAARELVQAVEHAARMQGSGRVELPENFDEEIAGSIQKVTETVKAASSDWRWMSAPLMAEPEQTSDNKPEDAAPEAEQKSGRG